MSGSGRGQSVGGQGGMLADQRYGFLGDLRGVRDLAHPPLADWHPQHCGEIDIRIDRHGRWYHEGELIRRQRLVRLFATILRREGDDYYLVTPVEKMLIEVEDVPFRCVLLEECMEQGQRVFYLTTNVAERLRLDASRGLRVEDADSSPRPYVHVRDGLEAMLDRSVFYQLAEAAEVRPAADGAGGDRLGVVSAGDFLVLGAV